MQTIDWILFGVLASVMIGAGLWASKRGGKDLASYFLGGRNLPWWMAGISMVATTFAADTPLAVTELVHDSGISGNWLWWNLLAGGMLTTFFFANLWRRSGVLTEVEFIQLRYGGKPAKFLRPFKAVYLGLFMNVLIIGWVNLAMVTILSGFFGIEESTAFTYTAITLFAVAIYSSLSGLLGVVITDNIQFVVAMTGSIALAYFVLDSPEIGGITQLKEALPESAFSFFPAVGESDSSVLSISSLAFFAFFGMMWWASWYPGAEPGGGGYIAQRMMSTKNENHAVYSTLFFQIAHYCLRPWPWIIVGLSALVLFNVPNKLSDSSQILWNEVASQEEALEGKSVGHWVLSGIEDVPEDIRPAIGQLKEQVETEWTENPALEQSIRYDADSRYGYIFALKNHVPSGWLGVLLIGFFAAYMSTISTQLNWGASYLINDLYLPNTKEKPSDKVQVQLSRITVLVLAVIGLVVSTFIQSISGVWQFIMECGAGLGLVLILRWFWWRINAWSEITATIAPFIGYAFAHSVLEVEFPHSFFVTVAFTTIAWVVVTFLTPPETDSVLKHFYQRIKPGGAWNQLEHIEPLDQSATSIEKPKSGTLWRLTGCWILAVIMTYSLLFTMGKIIFMQWNEALLYGGSAVLSAVLLNLLLKRTQILN